MKTCPNCSKKVNGHPNKKFCCQKCKDRYHNRTNPRGFYQPTLHGVAVPKGFSGITDQEHDRIMDDLGEGWDGHKDTF